MRYGERCSPAPRHELFVGPAVRVGCTWIGQVTARDVYGAAQRFAVQQRARPGAAIPTVRPKTRARIREHNPLGCCNRSLSRRLSGAYLLDAIQVGCLGFSGVV